MNKIVFNNTNGKKNRGAKVYGLPVSKELGTYLDEVDSNASYQRIIDMFFAGAGLNAIISNFDEEEDF